MADADSTSSPQEEITPTTAPVAEPTAPPEAVVLPEETPSEVKESLRVEETPPAPAEPEHVQNEPSVEQTGSTRQALEVPPVQMETAQSAPLEPLAPEPEPIPASQNIRDLRESARMKKQELKRRKLEKIVTELEKNGKISNDEVEKLLHVSDATATRYLSELEKEGKIRQVGKTGRGVAYEKV